MSARTGWMLMLSVAVLALVVRGDAAEKKDADKKSGVIEGTITNSTFGLDVPKRGNEICRIIVTAAKDKGVLSITPQTKILKTDGDKQVMALPKDLTPGSTVRAKFAQPVLQSRPWQAGALEVVILKQVK